MGEFLVNLGHMNIGGVISPFGIPFSGKKDQLICLVEYENEKRLYGIGKTTNGELGIVSTNAYDFTNIVNINPFAFSSYINGIELITGGTNHHCFVQPVTTSYTEDKIYTWGKNDKYQLGNVILDYCGNNLLKQQSGPASIDISFVFKNDDRIRTIDCGYNHTLVSTNSNRLFSWGSNYYGQIGISQNILDMSKGVLPTEIQLDLCNNDLFFARGGKNHTVVLTYQGNIFCYGDNNKSQLGISNDTLTYSYNTVKVPITGVIDVAVGEDFTIVLKNDGTTWGWGNDSHGQISLNTTIDISRNQIEPRFIYDDIAYISCGANHCLFLKKDATIKTSGDNTYQQSSLPLQNDKILFAYAVNNNSFIVNASKTIFGYGQGITDSYLLGKTQETTDSLINISQDPKINTDFTNTYGTFLEYDYEVIEQTVTKVTLFNDEDVIPSSSEYHSNKLSIHLLCDIEQATNSTRTTRKICCITPGDMKIQNVRFKSYKDRLRYDKALALTNTSCLVVND